MRKLRVGVLTVSLAVIVLASMMPQQQSALANTTGPATGQWTQKTPAYAPPARFGAAMAHNAGASASAMFGGCAATEKQLIEVSHTEPNVHTHTQNIEWCTNALSDAWTWANPAWSPITAPAGPAGRYASSLTFDYNANALVLFGGATWTVTTEMNPVPPAGSQQCEHAIVHLKILTGSSTGKYLNFFCFSDTWYLKKVGSTWSWQQKTPLQSPSARFDSFGAHDRSGQATIGQGCSKLGAMRFKDPTTDPSSYYFDCFHRRTDSANSVTGYQRDAWAWSHSAQTWTRIAANALADQGCRNENTKVPTCRRGTGASYNPNVEGVFDFGGFFLENLGGLSFSYNLQSFPADHVWQLDNAWLRTCRSDDLQCNGTPSGANTPGVRAFSSVATAFWEGAWRPMVFGGYGSNATNDGVQNHNDLWLWQDEPVAVHIGVIKGSWVGVCASATCSTRPSARASAAMTYMPGAAGHLVAFGGRNAAGMILADTWIFGAPSPPGANVCTSCVLM